jgi:hypothetical protein
MPIRARDGHISLRVQAGDIVKVKETGRGHAHPGEDLSLDILRIAFPHNFLDQQAQQDIAGAAVAMPGSRLGERRFPGEQRQVVGVFPQQIERALRSGHPDGVVERGDFAPFTAGCPKSMTISTII